MKTKEEIIEEIKLNAVDIIFNREAGWSDKLEKIIDFWITKAIAQTREETIREEIAYWTDVFDNRPKNRDLESDNIAQNFARIEIERLENKLKK